MIARKSGVYEANMANMEECAAYFKRTKGFKRLFLAFKDKYASYGKICGSIILDGPTPEEVEAVRGFMKKDFSGEPQMRISVSSFEKALGNTRYAGIDLEGLVFAYFGKELKSRKQERQDFNDSWESFWSDIIPGLCEDARVFITATLSEKRSPYAFLRKHHKQDPKKLREMVLAVSAAIQRIGEGRGELLRMPVLSAEISGDPHFFDEGSGANRLLISALCFKEGIPEPESAEEKNVLLFKRGVMRDDISNICTTYGIAATLAGGGDHLGLREFASIKEPISMSIANLWRVETAHPADKGVSEAYVVENPAVFAGMVELARKRRKPLAIVCSSGQFRWATWILLDKLVQSGAKVNYSGDFDPSGLRIADRAWRRYGDSLNLWRCGVDDYLAALSDVELPGLELAKLEKLENPVLKEVAAYIRKEKRAGYQERIMDRYLGDLEKGWEEPPD
jgi:uncharacterized protein (TIGR02679 family)